MMGRLVQAAEKRPCLPQAGICGVPLVHRRCGVPPKYASLLKTSGALHLDIFEQPIKIDFFSSLLSND
jgi:hypothetical protein